MRSSVYAQGAIALFSLFTLGSAAKAVCNPKGDPIPNFSTRDARELQNDLHGNNFNPKLDFPLFIEASHTASFSVGSAVACLKNVYSFQNTHIAQLDLANAVQNILDECENGDGTSKGGNYGIVGDTGVTIDIFLQDVAVPCY